MFRLPPRVIRSAFACICVLALISGTPAEAATRKNQRKKTPEEDSFYIPKDLEDCFAELDKLWSPKEREEFRKKPEAALIDYHFELGMWMRNRWRLWAGSRLQNHFAGLGVPHPESISMIIITSYWRRENQREIKLEEQIAQDRAEWEQQRKEHQAEEIRSAQALEKIGHLMLGYEYSASSAPSITMQQRSNDGIRARSLARFRGGVLLTIRETVPTDGPEDIYALVPYFFDLTEERIHPVRLLEVPDISYSVVAGDWLWVVGKGDGEVRLLALNEAAYTPITLPRTGEIPQLGLSGDQLLLIYSNSIYRRENQDWTQLYSGDLKLPLSGPPPRQYGDKIYFRDEGRDEDDKQLWYLELSPVPRLVTVWKDTGLVGSNGPRWENTFGYCVLGDGTLWASFGGLSQSKSVLRRAPDGEYRIAVFNNAVNVQGDLLGRTDTVGTDFVSTSSSGSKRSRSQKSNTKGGDISISGIAAKSDDELVAVADTGLFTIRGNQIRKLVAFRNTHQEIPMKDGHASHWDWDPTDILFLSDDSYLISDSFGGIYLLRQNQAKRWSLKSLDEKLGEPLIW